ncbi:MAG: hypothetical protein HY553_10305 [Elusimicrobia bacterium]|nr:hypothetical protein [Elusimicrobiota bacterium]
MRTWLFAALLLCAAAPGRAQTLRPQKPLRAPDLDSCLAKKHECWGFVERFFGKLLKARLLEVEGSLPDQFFPGQETMTLAKRGVDPDGHFLEVHCVRRTRTRIPCPAERDSLEERITLATLLDTFPKPKRPYVDPQKWTLTQAGQGALVKLRVAYPDLSKRLDRLLVRSLGRSSGVEAIRATQETQLEPDANLPFGGKQAPSEVQVEEDKPIKLLR